MKAKEYCCIDCGSDNLEFEVWVNEHDDIVNNGDTIWCNDCALSVKDIISKSEYKKYKEEEA